VYVVCKTLITDPQCRV